MEALKTEAPNYERVLDDRRYPARLLSATLDRGSCGLLYF